MKEVGVLEAKTNLSALLAEVEATGEAIAITRHGKRVARLTAEAAVRPSVPKRPWSEVAERLLRFADERAAANPKHLEPYDLRADRDAIE